MPEDHRTQNPTPPPASDNARVARSLRPAKALIVGSVMFSFISCWRTAAVVLCDLASTAYYIGGIVEQSIGPAMPWFILAVMLFTYAVRSVYIESCSMFVRGGVYRVVKKAMGSSLAKVSVSALLFDYMLTGPTSGVSAGQYLIGLAIDSLAILTPSLHAHLGLCDETVRDVVKRWGSVFFAVLITVYFFRQNILGIHESSGKALRIVLATSVMAVVVLIWGFVTVIVRGPVNHVPLKPDLSKKIEYQVVKTKDRVTGETKEQWARNPTTGLLIPRRDPSGRIVPKRNLVTGEQEDPLGVIERLSPVAAGKIREPTNWFGLIGLFALILAFGHSVLGMSGLETLAQVYREVEAPKLPNLKKAAFIVFVYSLILTVGVSFLAVLVIPDEVRMKDYADNLIGGIAMYVIGPPAARLLLNTFVVVVGFLILAGAVNTAIIGSNGVLNRVAEDGIMPEWFLKPHPRYGTTYRILALIVGLQLLTILVSRGHIYVLGEAYAFGIIWSFVFNSLAVVMLRFKDSSPREYKVPVSIHLGTIEIPLGLLFILSILFFTALANFFTKPIATVGGLAFTALFLGMFTLTEKLRPKRQLPGEPERLTQFSPKASSGVSRESLQLRRPFCKLVSIRSTQNLIMLEKALMETDPEITDVIVMTAKVVQWIAPVSTEVDDLDSYDRELMIAVLDRAEAVGKTVVPLIVPTNDAVYAIVRTARDLHANELIVGMSNLAAAEEQLAGLTKAWRTVHPDRKQRAPLTIRVLGRDRDIRYNIDGGNKIPTFGERHARSVAELRAAGIGIRRVLLLHDGSLYSSDLFQDVLTMLDPKVELAIMRTPSSRRTLSDAQARLDENRILASHLGRKIDMREETENPAEVARVGRFDLIIIPLANDRSEPLEDWADHVVRNAHCSVLLAAPPTIPKRLTESDQDASSWQSPQPAPAPH